MPKIRTIKSHKLTSQSRVQIPSTPSSVPASQAFSYTVPTKQTATIHPIDESSYRHVFHDLRKTLLLTAGIILAQILLFFFLGNR